MSKLHNYRPNFNKVGCLNLHEFETLCFLLSFVVRSKITCIIIIIIIIIIILNPK